MEKASAIRTRLGFDNSNQEISIVSVDSIEKHLPIVSSHGKNPTFELRKIMVSTFVDTSQVKGEFLKCEMYLIGGFRVESIRICS